MSKKKSGLGRGLGDLLDDNAPEIRSSGTVVRRDHDGDVSISPVETESTEIIHAISNDEYRDAHVHAVVTPLSVPEEDTDMAGDEAAENAAITEEAPISQEEKQAEDKQRPSLKAVFRSFK